MQKKILFIGLAFMLTNILQVNAQYSKQDNSYKRMFVGSSLFKLAPVAPSGFVQLNFGYRMTGKDVFSLELITSKYTFPEGINPCYNIAYGKAEEKYPGYIKEKGIGISYQRYFWKGLYASVYVTPMLQTFIKENGDKAGNGFKISNTYRIGYHVKIFKDRFFIEPSLGVAGRAYNTKMPDGFKEKDDKWQKWNLEPSLYFGFNF